MPCPYFFPVRPLGPGDWDPAPRMPLGATWFGECKAAAVVHSVPENDQRELCNSGYVRGRCVHFPENAPVDAVRFAFVPDGLIYILEKDHAPVEHGVLGPLEGDTILLTQARAFVMSQRSG